MYWSKLLTMVENMNLSKADLYGVRQVIWEAIYYYNSRHHWSPEPKKTDVVKFRIDGRYIEQSDILTSLGIIVEPREWSEEFTYCEEVVDFCPLWDLSCIVDKKETWIIFPFSLFSVDEEKDILEKLNNNDKSRKKVKYENVKVFNK